MNTIRLEVRGMSCDHCKHTVEKALSALPGVSSAAVDVARGTAEVTYDPARVTREAMAAAVDDAGYSVVGP